MEMKPKALQMLFAENYKHFLLKIIEKKNINF